MRCIDHRSLLALAASLCLAGCAQIVKIERPVAGAGNSYPAAVQLHFHSRFSQPFTAMMNGVDIAPSFATCIRSNTSCTVTPAGLREGNNTLVVTGRSSPIEYFDQYEDTLTFGLGPALAIAGPWRLAPIGTACSGPPPYTNCSTNVQMRQTQSLTGTVWIAPDPGQVVMVTITPYAANPRVSLNGLPAGQKLTIAIPAVGRHVDFNIQALQTGRFGLVATVDGYAASDSVLFNVAP